MYFLSCYSPYACTYTWMHWSEGAICPTSHSDGEGHLGWYHFLWCYSTEPYCTLWYHQQISWFWIWQRQAGHSHTGQIGWDPRLILAELGSTMTSVHSDNYMYNRPNSEKFIFLHYWMKHGCILYLASVTGKSIIVLKEMSVLDFVFLYQWTVRAGEQTRTYQRNLYWLLRGPVPVVRISCMPCFL